MHFDVPMLQVPIDGSKMFFRGTNTEYDLTFDSWITPTLCKFLMAFVGANPGLQSVSWIDPVMDFLSTEFVPLPVFTDYVVTETP